MAQLTYLGSLLGLPDLTDPAFPLAYSMFFGNPPPTNADQDIAAVTPTNVSHVTVTLLYYACYSLLPSNQKVCIHTSAKSSSYFVETEEQKPDKRKAPPIVGPPQKLRKIRLFELYDAVKPLSTAEQLTMSLDALKRILDAEREYMSVCIQL